MPHCGLVTGANRLHPVAAALIGTVGPSRTNIARHDGAMEAPKPAAHRWIKTDCGRAKYAELAGRSGASARLRLAWFVLIAAIRDWRLP
jgi:hypothetical protein